MLVFIGKKYCDISTHKWVFIMQVVSYFFFKNGWFLEVI